MAKTSRHHDWAAHLRDIREEIIGLLFNRYFFRTIHEIIRRNERLSNASGPFIQWTRVLYGPANSIGVRRLASQKYGKNDVSFVRLLDMVIPHAAELYGAFEHHFRADLTDYRSSTPLATCKRLIGKDRKLLLKAAQTAVQFANKRVVHHNRDIPVRTIFADLDKAIDTLKSLAEKYTLLIYDQKRDLLQEMKTRKLPKGWDKIFLEAWATPAMLALPLGDMTAPEKPTRR